jgi:competence protein ComEC
MKKHLKKVIPILVLLLIAAAFWYLDPIEESGVSAVQPAESDEISASLTLTVLDVGQGSAALLQAGDVSILIDAGERDQGESVRSALKAAGVTKLDRLILTHLHTDHYGGALSLIGSIPITEIWVPETPEELTPTIKMYSNLLDAIEDENVPVALLSSPAVYTLTEDVTLSVLDGFLETPESLNDTSLILRIDCGDASFLITGDAGTAQEDQLRLSGEPISVDVLVAGHHGSSTSSRQYFLNTVQPAASVISVGANNSYNLPNEHTVERLAAFGPIYRTDLNGTITFTTDGSTIRVTAKNIDDTLDAKGA